MKRSVLTVLVSGLGLSLMAADSAELKDQKQKFSYAIGLSWGGGLKRQSIDVDPDLVSRGIKDALAGVTNVMSEAESREIIMAFQKDLRAKQEETRKAEGEKNKKEGEEFLAKNKTAPGVIVLPSGLQYKVLAEGKGDCPKSNDVVTVNYRGTFIDGKEFDSSYKKGQPATFAANGVIPGWREALQLMKPGAKWQLFVPSALAYQDRGYGPTIPPNTALLFEVELMSFKPAQPPPTSTEAVTSDIIKVPSAEGLKKGEQIEVIKAADLEKEKAKAQAKEKADPQKK